MADRIALRIYALGNHRTGYRGVAAFTADVGDGSGPTVRSLACPHAHPTPGPARDCMRALIQDGLEAGGIVRSLDGRHPPVVADLEEEAAS